MRDLESANSSSVIYDGSNLGIPLSISFRKGRKFGEKKSNENMRYAYVEFIHPNSANKFLQITASRGFTVGGTKVRVYKAGTKPDRLFLKRKKNVKK
jgi:hypothetical protein